MTACKYDGKSCVYYKWTSELRKIRVQSINIVSKDKGLESAYRNELYNYLSVNLYCMKFILSFHHKSNHLIEYFSLWCHLYMYLILIVMSFVLLTSPWEIKSSFSLQHSFKTNQLSFLTIQIQHLLVIWGLECKSLTKKCLIFGEKSWDEKCKWI